MSDQGTPSAWMESKAGRYAEGLEVWQEGTKDFFGFLRDKSAVAQASEFMKGFGDVMTTMGAQSGLLGPLKDELGTFFETISGGVMEKIAPALAQFTETLGPFVEKIGNAVGKILEFAQGLIDGIDSWFASVLPPGTVNPLTGATMQTPDLMTVIAGGLFGIPMIIANIASWWYTGNFLI
jgi:phage-related protein